MVGLWRDRRAAAALEFAFVVPILIGLYFMTMETSQAIEANKKTGRIASMIADLVTQQQQVTEAEIDAIMKIGGSVIQPYNRTAPSIYVTGIEITDEDTPKVKVAWSRKMINGTASDHLTAGTTTTVPEDLKVRGTFLIRGEAELDYKPVLTWNAEKKATIGLAAAFDKISMGEQYYLRPRMSQQVKCVDC
ncbi:MULTISPECIES: TadE/TadG family type IV pilus assembly protein [Nitratireductor]|uniref:TadE/TadG family type IV pilus assembly protein n=1 Tax=Nitratireductor TaxID=245876 RepID=UPI001EE8A6F6|nr:MULTISPECIES: TadE/TadG family type IV pilus assembly protein [Nitratireductor]